MNKYIEPLPEIHQIALKWFEVNAQQVVPYPQNINDDLFLATKAKGIYKPAWSKYSLSIRESLSSPYPDIEPIYRPDGTWLYLYFQEGDNPLERNKYYTNLGLMEAMKDEVPVGVMIQVSPSPNLYKVLGLALVVGWIDGYFIFEGFSYKGEIHNTKTEYSDDLEIENNIDHFNFSQITDTRARIIAAVIRRQGQQKFRKLLLDRYMGKCVITGCEVENILHAAHIIPYQGLTTQHPENGLLLRSDIHNLFDLGLIAINEKTMTVLVSEKLASSGYKQYDGKKMFLPNDQTLWPSTHALEAHRVWAGL